MLAEANSAGDIAATLNLSGKTVANYHYMITSKLGAATDVELVRLAFHLNVVEPDCHRQCLVCNSRVARHECGQLVARTSTSPAEERRVVRFLTLDGN